MSDVKIRTQWGNNIIINLREKGKSPVTETQWGSNVVININTTKDVLAKDIKKALHKALNEIANKGIPKEMATDYDWNLVIVPENKLADVLENGKAKSSNWFKAFFLDSK